MHLKFCQNSAEALKPLFSSGKSPPQETKPSAGEKSPPQEKKPSAGVGVQGVAPPENTKTPF